MFHSEDKFNRLESNLKIVDILKGEIYKHPQLRFWQLLTCLGVIRYENGVDTPIVKDGFYEESVKTLNRIKNAISVSEK